MMLSRRRETLNAPNRRLNGVSGPYAPVAMHICLVYDCLFPYTIGGAERWYRNLAERLAAEGHRRHVPDAASLARGRGRGGAGSRGRRRSGRGSSSTPQADGGGSGPPLRLRRWAFSAISPAHGGRYDVVHTASFPYFSLLAAGAGPAPTSASGSSSTGTRSGRASTGASTSGPSPGAIGLAVQRRCVRVPHRAFCFSRLHARRLRERGPRGDVTVLEGEYAGRSSRPPPEPAEPRRRLRGPPHPGEAATALVPAIARARERVPELRGEIFGDGPDRPEVLRLIAEHGLEGAVEAPGFVRRGPIAQRASARALPRAALEARGLRPRGRRGGRARRAERRRARPRQRRHRARRGRRERRIAPSAEPDDLAAAIIRVHRAGPSSASPLPPGS